MVFGVQITCKFCVCQLTVEAVAEFLFSRSFSLVIEGLGFNER